jgi:starch synthase
MRIAFVASECVPFAKTGGLADVVGALPQAVAHMGHQVDVYLPRYRATRPAALAPCGNSITMPLGGGYHFASIQLGSDSGVVRHLLVDCPEFFDRDGLYQGRDGKDFPDNAERFAGFCLASLEYMKRAGKAPDVIHCHDWQSSLLPVYLQRLYSGDGFFSHTATLLTIHNLGYQGLFPVEMLPRLLLDYSVFHMEGLEFYGSINLLKGGIVYSDFITTVSRRYAQEIQTEEFGSGLEGVLRKRSSRVQGILNGVDYEAWDPARDKYLAASFSPSNLAGKQACKRALIEKMGVQNPDVNKPVIGIVSRFAGQKGFDLIAQIAEELMQMDLYIVALGTGEPQYEFLFRTLAFKYPLKFLVKVAYDNELAHQIEGGADMFLMPSRYEPCGLNQIYSLKYGTVPVVRATGGLDDTIEDFDGQKGTGFKFAEYTPTALLSTLQRAVATYQNKEAWRRLMLAGMEKDFSWDASARQYAAIYEDLSREKSITKAAP